MVLCGENLTHTLGGLPGLSHIMIEVGHMMTGLIAMRILSDQSRDVRGRVFAQVALHDEERVQFFRERAFPAKETDEAVHIVWHQPDILPGIAFRIVLHPVDFSGKGIPRQPPFPLLRTGAHKARMGIKIVLV